MMDDGYADAEALAKRIEGEWSLRVECCQTTPLLPVHAWVEWQGLDKDKKSIWGVRSNLVNGLPPRRKGCECRLPR